MLFSSPQASQCQAAQNHGDHAQHDGRSGPNHSVAAAGTTCSNGQIQRAVDQGD
jgi:hypothetical protein